MYKKLFQELLIYGFGTILPRLIMVAFNWLFTHEFTNEQYATFSDVVFIDTLCIQFLLFGFETAIFRYASNNENKADILKTAYTVVSFFVSIFTIIVTFFHQEIADFRGYPRAEYVLMGCFIIVCDVFISLSKTQYRLQSRPLMFTLINGLNTLIQAGLIIFMLYTTIGTQLVMFLTDRTGIPLLSNLGASFFIFLFVLPNTIKVFRNGMVSSELTRKLLRYGTPVAIASISFLINESFDKIAMKTILGETITGGYSACYKIATFMTLFEMAFRMGVEPFFFKQANNENRNKIYAQILSIYVFMGVSMYLFIMANLSWLKHLIIANDSYLFALQIVPYILLANILLGIYNNISVWYKITDRTYFGMYFSIIGACIMVFSCLVILPYFKDKSYNYMIPAWATLVVYGSMLFLSYIFSRKYNPINYPIAKILLMVIGSSLIAFLLFYSDFDLIIKNSIIFIFGLLMVYLELPILKRLIKK